MCFQTLLYVASPPLPGGDGDTLSPHPSLDAFDVSISAPMALRFQTPSVENFWLRPGTDMSIVISPNRSAPQLGKGRRLQYSGHEKNIANLTS